MHHGRTDLPVLVDFDLAVHSTHQNSSCFVSFRPLQGFDLGLDRPLFVLVVSAVPEKMCLAAAAIGIGLETGSWFLVLPW
jgi:hypothetical protein